MIDHAAAADPASVADWVLWSGFWVLPVLVASAVLSAVVLMVERRFEPPRSTPRLDRSTPLFDLVLGGLGYALINLFHGVRALVVNKRVNDLTGVDGFTATAFAIVHFGWAIALIAYLAVGFTAVS